MRTKVTHTSYRYNKSSLKSSWADSCVKVWKFSNISGTDSVLIYRVLLMAWWLPSHPQHTKFGDTISPFNVWEFSHLNKTVCSRRFYWILSPHKLQHLYLKSYVICKNRGSYLLNIYRSFQGERKINTYLWKTLYIKNIQNMTAVSPMIEKPYNPVI